MTVRPLYTAETCQLSYKLYWTLSIFWQHCALPADSWLETLKELTEKDGVRILEYRLDGDRIGQFLLSTRPEVSPSNAIRSVKGRLQNLVRHTAPLAFKGHYSIKSIGSAKHDVVQAYLDDQLTHHRMADPRVQTRMAENQIDHPQVDLKAVRRSAHGEFVYNLHLVLVYAERGPEIRKQRLAKSREGIQLIADKKGHLLAKVRILSDHIHLTLGCKVTESPLEVGLGYLNNLAFVHDQVPIFAPGFYVGTFGEYDLGAIRRFFR